MAEAESATSIGFRCKCGTVEGRLLDASARTGDHIACHCKDCRAFVSYLDANEEILFAKTGTALFNTSGSKLRVERGLEQLRCIHLTDKPTLRWFAGCCNTPLFNTNANNKLPFFDLLTATADSDRVEGQLGPITGHLFAENAENGGVGLRRLSLPGLVRMVLPRIMADVVRGRRRANPLFDDRTLKPITEPHHLTPEERERAYAPVS